MLNVGQSRNGRSSWRQLPSAGVGLARIEFIVSSWIGIHPMALLHPERVTDAAAAGEIRTRVGRHGTPQPSSSSSRLASGVAQIAAAFYPRPVIVRFSDFKTNEYAGLLGGTDFEPVEDNPMIGFRGASRYYDERYREAFALECAAIRRVRERDGPHQRQGDDSVLPDTGRRPARASRRWRRTACVGARTGCEVYVMCEIPNNVILAAEFAELFDGFSIGSNDLTQLALGVDRDSELLAPPVRRAGSRRSSS